MVTWENQKLGLRTYILPDLFAGHAMLRQNQQLVSVHYDHWPTLLLHGILFSCQSGYIPPNPLGFNKVNTRGFSEGQPVLLRTIWARLEQGKKLIIPPEGDDTDDRNLRVNSELGIKYSPRISPEGNLVYFMDRTEKVLTFDSSDMANFFEGLLRPMERNIRSTGSLPKLIYENFPWDFYQGMKR